MGPERYRHRFPCLALLGIISALGTHREGQEGNMARCRQRMGTYIWQLSCISTPGGTGLPKGIAQVKLRIVQLACIVIDG